MENEVMEGDVLGGFKGALDLVHGVDAAGFVRVQQVNCRCAGTAHLVIGKERRMHRPGFKRIGAEPSGKLCDVLAAGVVKVLASGKNLNRLRSGPAGKLQQPRVKALVQEQVR
jgi:hypothetical protein